MKGYQAIDWVEVEAAKKAALEVMLHNSRGPFRGLPRTSGWGYPEPYTRDMMFALLGVAVTGNRELMAGMRRILQTLAKNQTAHGHIPSLVHDKEDRGASDTTPLFLLGTAVFRKLTGEPDFLEDAVNKSLTWMEYQSPTDRYMVAQQPTSDWRDEQWVLGYGLYVNTLMYAALRLLGHHDRAGKLKKEMLQITIDGGFILYHQHEGFRLTNVPFFAFWTYKVYCSPRFDLLGNSLAILTGLAPAAQARAIVDWVEQDCILMRQKGDLAVGVPPNFFPFTLPGDPDWNPRYENFNMPGNYHNGGIWPFICAIYVAALVAAKKYDLAGHQLMELTKVVRLAKNTSLQFGFNEWIKAQTGMPMGDDWQSWSAALYLYAAKCVEEKRTPFFDEIR